MPFSTFNASVVAAPAGQQAYVLAVRNDSSQIAMIDTNAIRPVDFCRADWHVFTGDSPDRMLRKKCLRINVFGKGNLPAPASIPGNAYMIVTADDNRYDTYLYSPQAAVTAEGILWQQNTLPLVGRVFSVALFLMGSSIEIPAVGLEYSVVG